jgi:hypothetical protein
MIFALLQAAADTAGTAPAALDWAQVGADVITALVPPLTILFVWGTRKLIPKIPRAILPFLALGGGAAINAAISALAGIQDQGLIVGALLGAVAVWLREMWTTFQEHGVKP